MSDLAQLTVERADIRSDEARRLIRRMFAELGERYGDMDNFDPTRIRVDGGAFVIARLDGEPVGCGAVRPLTPGVGELKRIFVEPHARRRGIARRIVEALEHAAHELGFNALCLETGTLQPEAILLYEALGYTRIPCYGDYADDPESVCFEKRLP